MLLFFFSKSGDLRTVVYAYNMIINFDCALSENDWLRSNVSLRAQTERQVRNFQITEHKNNSFLDVRRVFGTSMDVLFC